MYHSGIRHSRNACSIIIIVVAPNRFWGSAGLLVVLQVAKEKDEDTNPVQEEELAKTCHLTLGQAWPRAAATQGKTGYTG